MGKIDLKELASRESEQVEWKENVADVEDVVRTIAAFANDYSNLGGGYVVCGAKESKDAHGFQKMEIPGLTSGQLREIEGRVLTLCREKVEPTLTPLLEELPASTDDRRILVFIVPSTGYAHSFRRAGDSGKYYIRISRETREARNGILRELFVRKRIQEPWDRRAHPAATVDDIDLLALREVMKRVGLWDNSKGLEDYLSATVQLSPFVPTLCIKEGLTNVLRPRNFALLLFGRNIQRFFEGAISSFSIYPGPDRSEPFAERIMLDGNILDQIAHVLDKLNTEAYTVMDKTGQKSPNLVKYPQRALHEAVVNAFAHRDYESDQPVRITIFSERIEIFSPGALPSAIDQAKFVEGRATPYWRNQALAWFFNKLQLAQAEGQGIATILRTMKEEGCPTPTFELSLDSVLCSLPAHPRHALLRELQDIEKAIVIGNLSDAEQKIDKLLDKDPFNSRTVELFCELEKLSGKPQKIYDFVRKHENNISAFTAHSQIILAETLASMDMNAEIVTLALRLLKLASQGQFEADEAKRLAVGLRKLGKDEDALAYLERMLLIHPHWQENATFSQLKGKCLIELAKRCMDTARHRDSSRQIKGKAWEQCRTYLHEAEKCLNESLQHSKNLTDTKWIEKDMGFLFKLKQVATKPKSSHKN